MHIDCNHNTRFTIKDKLTKIIFSGLYEKVDKIYYYLSGNKFTFQHVRMIMSFYGAKFVPVNLSEPNWSEMHTLLHIREMIQPEDKFLYISEGGGDDWAAPAPEVSAEFRLYTNFNKIIKLLDTSHIVGVRYNEYYEEMHIPHLYGKLWWSNGVYYLNLPNTTINKCELYPFLGGGNRAIMCDFMKETDNTDDSS